MTIDEARAELEKAIVEKNNLDLEMQQLGNAVRRAQKEYNEAFNKRGRIMKNIDNLLDCYSNRLKEVGK